MVPGAAEAALDRDVRVRAAAEDLQGQRLVHAARALFQKALMLALGVGDAAERGPEADADARLRALLRPRKPGVFEREQRAGDGELRVAVETFQPMWREESAGSQSAISPPQWARNSELSKRVIR